MLLGSYINKAVDIPVVDGPILKVEVTYDASDIARALLV